MAREFGHVNVDSMLDSISFKQAREWELYSKENPLPHQQIMTQLAVIAYRFAMAFIKFKDGSHYTIKDFLPVFGKQEQEQGNVVQEAKSMVMALGDEKAKKKFFTEEELKPIVGKDGKRYKYALEEKIKERKTPPKRKTRTKFGSIRDHMKEKDTKAPSRFSKIEKGI